MKAAEQRDYVRELSDRVAEGIVKLIDEGKIPSQWDGHELRCLFAMHSGKAAAHTELRRNKRGNRAKSFNALVIQKNL